MVAVQWQCRIMCSLRTSAASSAVMAMWWAILWPWLAGCRPGCIGSRSPALISWAIGYLCIVLVYLTIKLALDVKIAVLSVLGAFTQRSQASSEVAIADVDGQDKTDYVVLRPDKPLIKTTAGTCLHYDSCGIIKTVAQHRRSELTLCRQCIPKVGAKGKHE